MRKITKKKKAQKISVGMEVSVQGANGHVSKINDDGTFSVRLAEARPSGSFLHQLRPEDVTKN